jgi:GT2 family glycosyltransferase
MPPEGKKLGVSVVICAHTEQRWDQLCAAVKSALSQYPAPAEVLLVVDHNPLLAARARHELAGVTVLESDDVPGLSGARNTGLRAAAMPITAFLGDGAEARPGWLESLVKPFGCVDVVATGGAVHPWWPELPPRWLPAEFYWVIGCSYRGLPAYVGPVRNPIGANMSMRTELALQAGGFRAGQRLAGGAETELAIRLTARGPSAAVFYVPSAAVDHHIGPDHLTPGYFLRRCWYEGIAKAGVVRRTGGAAGLERERRHVAVVIPQALLGNARQLATGDPAAFVRGTVMLAGLASATSGFLAGRLRLTPASRA